MFTKYLDPKNDLAFKKIFGTVKHKDISIAFLNAVFHLKGAHRIKDLEFIDTVQSPEIQVQKESIVDVLVKDERGDRYIVEMQVAKTPGFEKRAQYYAAKTYCSHVKPGEEYANLKRVVFLAITSYTVFPNKPGYKSEHVILDRESYEQDLKDFSFTFVELPKFTLEEHELKTIEEQWYYFFKHAVESNAIIPVLAVNKDIRQAYEIVERFNWTESELRSYEKNKMALMDAASRMKGSFEEGRKRGVTEGRKQGIAEGAKQTDQKWIKTLLAKSFPLATIAEITGLNKAEIAEIAKS